MKLIEENTEQLDLLERAFLLEERQRKRLMDFSIKKENEIGKDKHKTMYEGYINSTTTLLDQEETQRKSLVDEMVRAATPSNAPTVKVLTNLQGNLQYVVIFWRLIVVVRAYGAVDVRFFWRRGCPSFRRRRCPVLMALLMSVLLAPSLSD